MSVTAPQPLALRPDDAKSPTPSTRSNISEEKRDITQQPPLSSAITPLNPNHEVPEAHEIVNPTRKLSRKQLATQRGLFIALVLIVNLGLGLVATLSYHGSFVLAFIIFVKTKDFIYGIVSLIGLLVQSLYRYFQSPEEVSRKWIVSLIPVYAESKEQILRSIASLQNNDPAPHKQIMVVVLDGKPKDIRSNVTRIVTDVEHPYVDFKYKLSSLRLTAGWIRDAPVIVIEKSRNSGKKDSLILCHDIFNFPRENMPSYTKLLRDRIWRDVLPQLTASDDFYGFDMVFCTDADSIIHKGAIANLTNAMARDKKAIACCGLVLVETEPGHEWSFWNLFQQVQYTYGQFIRRRAEGYIGRVTCLPGCITMTAVREEMADAIQKFAAPVTAYSILHHQVQYLGTDRRLTYCMLSQSKHLRTLFVPSAVSETVAPLSLRHYLSQRRRWGSNAYFNNFFYCGGINQMLPIRIAAFIDVVRQTFVYYRILNTIFFIKSLATHFVFWKILPLLVVAQLPVVCYVLAVVTELELRKRSHKIVIGFVIDKLISPFLSISVFTIVAWNLGSQAWGFSGITASSQPTTQTNEKDALSAAEEGRGQEGVVVHRADRREIPV